MPGAPMTGASSAPAESNSDRVVQRGMLDPCSAAFKLGIIPSRPEVCILALRFLGATKSIYGDIDPIDSASAHGAT